jgi:hypothetical protein
LQIKWDYKNKKFPFNPIFVKAFEAKETTRQAPFLLSLVNVSHLQRWMTE